MDHPGSEADHSVADPDLAKGDWLLQQRWPRLLVVLEEKYHFTMRVIEVYRPELRQQWLYGAGRSVGELALRGIRPEFARPRSQRVTRAWSASVSAHGATIWNEARRQQVPASAALDVVPLGVDGKPWTPDDPWDAFLGAIAAEGPMLGLTHFHSPGKGVWDRPHLQLWPEWSDREHRLVLA